MKNLIRSVMLLFCLGSMMACAKLSAPTSASAPPKLDTEDQKTLYALGVLLGRNTQTFALTPDELAIVKAGLTDAVTDTKLQVDLDTYGPKVRELANSRAAGAADDAKKKGQEFADKVAQEKDATKTASGIVVRTITPGNGASPSVEDTVKISYEGRFINGTVFDSTVKLGQPTEIALKGAMPCWQEALQQMKKGEKAQIVCPSSSAFGDRGAPPAVPPGATLNYEMELLDFHKP
jgi:FKBP-type peptidyl-prolyl cis-trans isomerase FkpA